MKYLLALLSCISFSVLVSAQTPRDPKNGKIPRPAPVRKAGSDAPVKAYGGIGIGLDHGGIGAKFEYLPVSSLGIFLGIGTNLNGLGFNAGAHYKFLPESDIRPILTAMYGYNAVIVVKYNGNTLSKETYYGPTFGGGAEFDMGRTRRNKLTAQVLIPIRSQEFKEDSDALDGNVLPFAISLGYSWAF